MQILADENVPGSVVAALRQQGHDVLWVAEAMPAISDGEVLRRARENGCVLLTHDKDFGELAFHSGLPAISGVILLRLSGTGPEADRLRTVQAIQSRDDWAGHFSVIDNEKIRMRRLPE